MKKDIAVKQWRTGVTNPIDINVHKESTKPNQLYDKKEISKDTGSGTPKKVWHNG